MHLELECPAGMRLDHVEFASYGQPSGACECQGAVESECVPEQDGHCDGLYHDKPCDCSAFEVRSKCDSDKDKAPYFTIDVIEKHCLGKESCVVPATNEVFGDSCEGEDKWLSVAMRCSDRWTTKDYVDCAEVLPLLNASGYTFAAWVNPGAKPGAQAVLSFGATEGYMNRGLLQWHGAEDGSCGSFYYYDDCVNDVFPKLANGENLELAVNQWYYVAVTVANNGEGQLYVDGFEVAHWATTSRPAKTAELGSCYLGMDLDDLGVPKEFFAGLVDEVRFYDHALSGDEVAATGCYTAASAAPGLVAHYQMNVDAGVDVLDATGLTTATLAHVDLVDADGNEYKTAIVARAPIGAPWFPTWTRSVTDASSPASQHYTRVASQLYAEREVTVKGINFASQASASYEGADAAWYRVASDVELTAELPRVETREEAHSAPVAVTNGFFPGSLEVVQWERYWQEPDLAAELHAYFPFYGNADDYGPGAHHGAVEGSATLVPNRNMFPSQAYLFDGKSEIVFTPVPSETFTVAMWVRLADTELAEYQTCAGYQNSPFEQTIAESTVDRTTFVPGAWKHVAVVHREGAEPAMRHFLNGVPTGESDEQADMYAMLALEAAMGRIGRELVGEVDDVMVWARALPDDQVKMVFDMDGFALEFGSGATVTVPRGDTPLGASGLLATYSCAGGAVETDIVTEVEHYWGHSDACGNDHADAWTADYTGYVYAPYDGEYTFYVTADDTVALAVDGNAVVDRVYEGSEKQAKGVIDLTVGWYPIMLHYRDVSGVSNVTLEWSSAKSGIPRGPVPSVHLKAGTGAFTLQAWVWPYTVDGRQTIISRSAGAGVAGIAFGIEDGGLTVGAYTGACPANERPNVKCEAYREVRSWRSKVHAETWQNVAVMYTGESYYFFVDGILTDFHEYDEKRYPAESQEPIVVGREVHPNHESAVIGDLHFGGPDD
eukprot:7608941-Pyramimonas_sp.AAC.1